MNRVSSKQLKKLIRFEANRFVFKKLSHHQRFKKFYISPSHCLLSKCQYILIYHFLAPRWGITYHFLHLPTKLIYLSVALRYVKINLTFSCQELLNLLMIHLIKSLLHLIGIHKNLCYFLMLYF